MAHAPPGAESGRDPSMRPGNSAEEEELLTAFEESEKHYVAPYVSRIEALEQNESRLEGLLEQKGARIVALEERVTALEESVAYALDGLKANAQKVTALEARLVGTTPGGTATATATATNSKSADAASSASAPPTQAAAIPAVPPLVAPPNETPTTPVQTPGQASSASARRGADDGDSAQRESPSSEQQPPQRKRGRPKKTDEAPVSVSTTRRRVSCYACGAAEVDASNPVCSPCAARGQSALEKIVAKRLIQGKTAYLMRWKPHGNRSFDDAWHYYEDIRDTFGNFIHDFNREERKKKRKISTLLEGSSNPPGGHLAPPHLERTMEQNNDDARQQSDDDDDRPGDAPTGAAGAGGGGTTASPVVVQVPPPPPAAKQEGPVSRQLPVEGRSSKKKRQTRGGGKYDDHDHDTSQPASLSKKNHQRLMEASSILDLDRWASVREDAPKRTNERTNERTNDAEDRLLESAERRGLVVKLPQRVLAWVARMNGTQPKPASPRNKVTAREEEGAAQTGPGK
eukprot:CAMPEP_0118902626 /NCGR_PEP_ID=MMETSP1166-20130328/7826_1 /TAXON_ID=1104430 /ORGANISM="Chrysoreinhardia sp, Strain CCMP3193" /LENGTH=515 /DNA_ID=CAMNT_0006841839 /DNA_START=12 /DNA_END=1560 /DNA_ORIENTATION=+